MKSYKNNRKLILGLIAFAPALILTNCTKSTDTTLPSAIQTTGTVTTFAGSGGSGLTNGTGASATFFYPQGVAVDASGIVYVADQGNNAIRKITAAGAVTTLAGVPVIAGGSTNSSAAGAIPLFNGPTGVAVDASGNLYVADYTNNLVRKIVIATGTVSTLAGTGKAGSTNATGTLAAFSGPAGVAVDAAGNVYVADFVNNLIRKITAAGVVTTLAGTAGTAGFTNGTPGTFNGPRGVAVDAAGNVYVADANNNAIRMITPAGLVSTFAGTGSAGNASGAANAANFRYPSGVAVDAAGNVYVADANNNLVRKITAGGGTVTSLAGSGYLSLTTPFNAPVGVAVDAAGVVYVANEYGNLIQKVQ